jgi:hypothetical protein
METPMATGLDEEWVLKSFPSIWISLSTSREIFGKGVVHAECMRDACGVRPVSPIEAG